MKKEVTREQVTETERIGGSIRFATEASTLGLPPGTFPELLTTEIGNGLPFQRMRLCQEHGIYQQVAGCCELVVFND